MAYVRQYLRVGDLAYFDGVIAGPIPCRVIRIWHEHGAYKDGTFRPSSMVHCEVTFTAHRGPYKRGDTMRAWSLHVFPRKALRTHHGVLRIMPYDVVVPAPVLP